MAQRDTRVSNDLLQFAREMRKAPAPAEKKLWHCLRDRRLNGLKFRRQVPIEAYVTDFCCIEHHLIIEADGESHCERQEYDEERTARLTQLGFSVLRFSNVDIHENLEGVLLAILQRCGVSNGTPSPSPQPSPPEYRGRGSRL